MPATVTRLILSMASVLLAAALYLPVFFIIERGRLISDDTTALWVTNIVCGGVLVLTWILVWRSEVSWTPHRRLMTAVSPILAAVPGTLIVIVMQLLESHNIDELTAIFGVMVWAPCWIGCTAVVWRETRVEREERLKMQGIGALVCPTCGYSMMGLRESRCPECGSRFTLDQLYASQKPQGLEVA